MNNDSTQKLALEPFATNPYRILGISCISSKQEIIRAYEKLSKLSKLDSLESYTSAFDLTQLPQVIRDEGLINVAQMKAFAPINKAFAFADASYAVPLTIEDCAENVEDISSYDCFLSCYLWLLLNDLDYHYKGLWIKLCNHLDKMLIAEINEWEIYFDNRFRDDEISQNFNCYKDFHTVFTNNILLPFKTLVKGSNQAKTSLEIFEMAQTPLSEIQTKANSDELNKLAQIAEKETKARNGFNLVNESKNSQKSKVTLVYEETPTIYEKIDLVAEMDTSENIYDQVAKKTGINNERNISIDSIDTSKGLANVGYAQDYDNRQNIKMDSIDINAKVQSLVSPKKNVAMEMNGLLNSEDGAKTVISSQYIAPPPKSISRTEFTNQVSETFEDRQDKIKKNEYRMQHIKVGFGIVILLGALAFFCYHKITNI